jgi:hypothetical protein
MSHNRWKYYREKLKEPENIEKLEEIREKNKERSRKYRERILLGDPEKAAEYRKRKAQNTREYRKRCKISESTGYNSSRGLNYAVNRYDAQLPEDARKKAAILDILHNKYVPSEGVTAAAELKSRVNTREGHHKVFNKKHQNVIDFYLREDISRCMPGMKDYVLIKNFDGTKERIQTRYMTMTTEAAFKLYLSEKFESFVGKTTFYSLRPPHVQLSFKTPHDVCSCQYHQDMTLLHESLSKFYIDRNINSTKLLLEKLVCSKENYSCMAGQCNKCKSFSIKLKSLVDTSKLLDTTNLVQWDLSEHTPRKKSTRCTLKDLLDKFDKKFPEYKLHAYITLVQHQTFREMKENLQVKTFILIAMVVMRVEGGHGD